MAEQLAKEDAAVEVKESTGTDEAASKADNIADEIAKKVVPFANEDAPKAAEADTSEPLGEDTSTQEKTDGEQIGEADSKSDASEIDEILKGDKEEQSKSKVQKRIDTLTAKLKNLEEENALLKGKTETKGEREYTRQELRAAMKKAQEEGDSDLMMDIFDYQIERTEKRLIQKYEDRQKAVQETAKRNAEEWTQIQESYDYLADKEEPEIYPNARKELNIRDHSSLLYQLAIALYNGYQPGSDEPDEELKKYYRKPGGQKLAVADALSAILRKKRGLKGEDKEKKLLENKLAKAKRRSSLAGGDALKTEEPPKPKFYATDKERLDDYIRGRKKRKQEALNALLERE